MALTTLAQVAWVGVPLLLVYLYDRLRAYRFRQNFNIPQPKPSLILGNMGTVGEYMKKGNPERNTDYIWSDISKALGDPPLYLVDVRPFSAYPICIVNSHEIAEKLSKASKLFAYGTTKSPTMSSLQPIVGRESILIQDGEEWKSLRKIFNPGFAPQHLISLLPRICEKTIPFVNRLDELARSGEEFALDSLCVSLTFDIIGAVVLDLDLHAQAPEEQQSQIVRDYTKLLGAFSDIGMGVIVMPWTALRRWYRGRKADQAVKAAIQQKFDEVKNPQATKSATAAKSVVALALQHVDKLTPGLLQQTADQIKTFLFAGHDTTAILLQWAIYELSRHPRALATLRAEHDEVLGPDTSPAAVIEAFTTRGEETMRRMKYTSAVIKEVLRLYPPAGTARFAPKGTGFTLPVGADGRDACVDGMVLYICHHLIQRDRAVYGDTADVFVPERWLGDADTDAAASAAAVAEDSAGTGAGKPRDDKRTPASAWRPFERGPRHCIGQELANIEARVILACIARRYDFVKVGIGALDYDADGNVVVDDVGRGKCPGEELFNRRQVTSRPVDGTKVRVSLRK
ncbi:cytochrome P450 52A11 [Lineolata rhizophorae]|uniref:Cytochrome P450 52A11 n=1 Tax=Lineolata rhizophorae TaxID=578093 RepID=A0A6A6NW85_9PEZI|nr:cytochrome P450 52A11 [Lineolata rhizophorae]